jgi:hypothetical protein
MMKKAAFAFATACVAAALFAASPVTSGEVNGRGEPIPATDNAASECSFSGLNDNPVNPPPRDFPGRVQSFGSFLKFLAGVLGFRINPLDAPSYPGEGCNPTNE